MKLPWLEQHGHHNVFTFFSEEQCHALLHNLEQQLHTEEQLEMAAREVVALTLHVSETSHASGLAETIAIAEPQPTLLPSAPQTTARTAPIFLYVGAICLLVAWSFLLYRYAYQQGMTSPALAVASCNSPASQDQTVSLASFAKLCSTPGCSAKIQTSHPERPALWANLSERTMSQSTLWNQALSWPLSFPSENAPLQPENTTLLPHTSSSPKAWLPETLGRKNKALSLLSSEQPWPADPWEENVFSVSSQQFQLHSFSTQESPVHLLLLHPLRLSHQRF